MKPSTRMFIAKRRQGFWSLVMLIFRPFANVYHFASRKEIAAINEHTNVLISELRRDAVKATKAK